MYKTQHDPARHGALLLSVSLITLAACGSRSGGADSYHDAELAGSSGYYYDESAPDNSGDMYDDPGTNPFVHVAHDPFSTFAVDVDTASYDIFRRDIEDGRLPMPASVRLEEHVNYFHYDYPAPAASGPHPFTISLAAAPHALGAATTLLRVGIQGTEPPPFQKKPANLVFLVDVSGSMGSTDKLPLVKTVLRETLTVLDPTDTISIVTYASNTGVVLVPTLVSNAQTISAAINGLQAGGSTAGASGIELAYQQVAAGFIAGGINHVLLCTDGDFNVGISSTDDLVTLIKEKRDTGITLTVLGFGVGNLNDGMMEAISNAGNGIYGVISSEQQARKYVAERMLSTLVHIAKDVKIQVEFNPVHVYAYRLLGYENRAINDQDFRNDGIDAGEIGAGHRVTALYELVMVGESLPTAQAAPAMLDGDAVAGTREISGDELVLVKVRYKQPDAGTQDPATEVNATLLPADIAQSSNGADADFQWAAAVAAFAEILKGSPYAEMQYLDGIEAIVTAQSGRDADRAEFVSLFAQARQLLQP